MSLLQSREAIPYRPEIAKRTSVNAAILAQQIYYWQGREGVGREHEGKRWIFNSLESWSDQLGMSVDRVRGAIKLLKDLGALETAKLDKAKHDQTLFYRVNPLHEIFADPAESQTCTSDNAQTDHLVFPNPSSDSPECLKTETTSKTTSEKGSQRGASAPPSPLKQARDALKPLAERLSALMAEHCEREGYSVSNPPEAVAQVLEQIIRIDEIAEGQIEPALRWAVADPFWSSNVRSLLNLRCWGDAPVRCDGGSADVLSQG